jgi:hypothetical protein
MGSLLEQEEELSFEFTFPSSGISKPVSINEKCKNEDVCVYPCNKIIPNCNKKVYFSDFLSQIPKNGLKTVAEGYVKSCIQRKYDSPSEYFWMKEQLFSLANQAIQTINPTVKPKIHAGMSYVDMVQKLLETKENIFVYLSRMSELLLTLDKMCQQNETWRKDLKLKIVDLMDSDTTDIKTHFSGNKFLMEEMIGRYQSAVKAKLQFDSTHKTSERRNFHKLKKQFKLKYLQNAQKGDNVGYLCRCDYFIRGGVVKYYKNGLMMVKKECGAICQTKKHAKVIKGKSRGKKTDPSKSISKAKMNEDLSSKEKEVIDKIAKKIEETILE